MREYIRACIERKIEPSATAKISYFWAWWEPIQMPSIDQARNNPSSTSLCNLLMLADNFRSKYKTQKCRDLKNAKNKAAEPAVCLI